MNKLRSYVLGVHPSSRGFGWALFEGPLVPFDWGTADIRSDKNARALTRFEQLLEKYEPSAIAMEAFDFEHARRSARIRKLCQGMISRAEARGIKVRLYTRKQIGKTFAAENAKTREEIAAAVAGRIAVLQPRLPKPRKRSVPDAMEVGLLGQSSRASGSTGILRCSRCAREVSMASEVLSESRSDVFKSITDKIVTSYRGGAEQFVMPWHGSIVPPTFPVNAATDTPYRGVNIVALWTDAMFKRYIGGYWASYRQWQTLGAQVRKGERGSLIVFWKKLERQDDAKDEEDDRPRFVANASYVFNAEQVSGWQPPTPKPYSEVAINEQVAAFIRATGADIRHGFHAARYRRDLDCIEMPNPDLFIGSGTSSPIEAYHAVLGHESIHWSGAVHRLNREFGKRFGDKAYAFEEIVAELGAAFLCSAFRIVNEPRPDHAAYVASWLDILDRDTKAIFTAASKVQEAVEYLMHLAAANSGQ